MKAWQVVCIAGWALCFSPVAPLGVALIVASVIFHNRWDYDV